MASRPPAPGDLELVRLFVNTLDVEDAKDDLTSAEALADWYRDKRLIGPAARVSAADLNEALAVRDALREILFANHGGPLDEEAAATVNKVLTSRPLVLRLGREGIEFAPAQPSDAGAALARLLAICFRSMADGTWPRLKICRADTCRWAFYDRSRNRSGSWCSMAICGNRTKVRNYQRRSKELEASQGGGIT